MVEASVVIGIFSDGLARGAIFALLGVSITLVFGLGEIMNLAIGVTGVVAMITVMELHATVGLPLAFAAAFAVVLVGGLVVDRSMLSLIYRSDEEEERVLLGIFTTVGLAIAVQGILNVFFTGTYSLPIDIEPVILAGIYIRGGSVAAVAVSLVIFVILYAFFTRTFLGKATRTVMQDETGALLYGINPRRIRTVIWELSLVLGAVAVLLASLSGTVNANAGFGFSIFAVMVSIVGGVTNVTRTVVAGFFLGVVEVLTSAFIGSNVASIILFMVIFAVLLISPESGTSGATA